MSSDELKVESDSTAQTTLNVKDCSMNSVVIYRDRAEVKRVVPVSIIGGENEIVITGLSEAVDGDSIRLVFLFFNVFHLVFSYTVLKVRVQLQYLMLSTIRGKRRL